MDRHGAVRRPQHLVQNLGDGTFFHSGSLAVRAAVAAGVNITYKLLYNGTVAMTGGQDAAGQPRRPRRDAHAPGRGRQADHHHHRGHRDRYPTATSFPDDVEVWDRSRIIEAQRVLAAVAGTTVLIHDQRCAAEKRRDRKRGLLAKPPLRVVINERICEGCGDCGDKSNCLSVQPVDTPFGRKTAIHQTSCNYDFSCMKGDCPAFATVSRRPSTGASRPSRARRRQVAPEPDVRSPPRWRSSTPTTSPSGSPASAAPA